MTQKELVQAVSPMIDSYRIKNHCTYRQAVDALVDGLKRERITKRTLLTSSEWLDTKRFRRTSKRIVNHALHADIYH